MRRVLSFGLVVLVSATLLAGCLGGGPRPRPDTTGTDQTDQIEKAVKKQFKENEDVTSLIRDETKKTAQGQMLDDMLKSPDNQKKIQEALTKLLDTPDGHKALSDALKKVVSAPDAKKQIQDAVKAALTEMMSSGAGAGKQAGGGGGGGGGAGGAGGGS